MAMEGDKVIHVRVKAALHKTLKRICVDMSMTQTEVISQYLHYLKRHKLQSKWVLNERSDPKFQLDKNA